MYTETLVVAEYVCAWLVHAARRGDTDQRLIAAVHQAHELVSAKPELHSLLERAQEEAEPDREDEGARDQLVWAVVDAATRDTEFAEALLRASRELTAAARGIPASYRGQLTVKKAHNLAEEARPEDPSNHPSAEPSDAFLKDGAAAVAKAAEETLEHALACLFVRLGPPPEPTELDYTPVGSGDGGVRQ